MEKLPVVLICDDDATFQLAVKHTLKGKFDCKTAYNSDEALAIARRQPVDAVILDVQMRTKDEGLRAIPRLLEQDPNLAIVMSSGLTDFETVLEAMKLGAADYVAKDFEPSALAITLAGVLERRGLRQRREQQNFEAVSNQRQHVLVGESQAMQKLRRTIEKVRASNASVMISGETGTGKEVVARQLRRTLADGTIEPFVAVDSSTIQSTMAESQLFGHEKGAFTGADQAKKGLFEEADGGIIYFDELANMPLEIQAKLLRVIQEREVMRLGSSKALKLEFRVVCATNRDLGAMAKAGRFKDDLLQRLNVIPIELPPLRERREDVPGLVEHFAKKQPVPLSFTRDALETLSRYSWPGNIRELANLVAYVAVLSDGPEIDVADLPPKLRDEARAGAGDGGFYSRVAEFEKKELTREYERVEGNVSRLALELKMDRSHLYTKLRDYGIHAGRAKS
jgi:DNA-binding NtrC family response regulator